MKQQGLLLLCLFTVFGVYGQGKKIELEDIYGRGTFRSKSVSGVRWMNDGRYYSARQGRDVVKIDVATGEVAETIVKGSDLNPSINWVAYEFSSDEKQMLFMTEFESIYRRSFKANYYVYSLETKELKPLSEGGKQSYATFSPDGKRIAFARNNNLFYVDVATMEEVQITTNGKFNHIINGSTDWVYEEEFGFAKAFYWSPDGNKLAFYTFDESEVKEYNMQVWNDKAVYPIDYRFKYPKAGEANSVVKISVYDLNAKKVTPMDIGTETDIYIPRINWTQDSDLLSIRRMNRLQQKLEIIHADVASGKGEVILTEENDTYVDINYCDNLTYLEDGKHFIRTSEQDGFKHIYLHKVKNGKLVRQVTKGNWEVTEFIGLDQDAKRFYYISTEESPLERHFYSIDMKGENKQKLSASKGTNSVNMSPDFSLYLNYHSSIESPTTVTLYEVEGNKIVKVMEDNAELRETLKEYSMNMPEFFKVLTEDQVELDGWMIKPADFDESKKYPVLMFVYGGPGSQLVTNSWAGRNFYFHQMLAQEGYIVACVDNRGTDGRGAKFKKSTYANLGKYEVQDQVAVAKHLGSLGYVDAERIGIWGWSYGGYMSSLCMTLGADVFKAGIAVAPVSNWRFYDTIYTERFLQRPQDNASGYDEYSPVYHADKLKGKFMLIHGTGDDNVHFQNAIALQNALIDANKQFESFYYPNRNHGIYGGTTRYHLYKMMFEFWKRSL